MGISLEVACSISHVTASAVLGLVYLNRTTIYWSLDLPVYMVQ